MRICVVVPSYYPATIYGGPIVSIHQTSKALASLGVDVFVSTTNANGTRKLDVERNAYLPFGPNYFVKYYDDTLIGRFSWRFVVSVWRDIRSADLVRVEDIFSTYIPPSLLFAKLFGKPVLISPRGVLSSWSLSSKRRWLKWLWSALLIKPFLRGSWWHATSAAEQAEILQYFPAAKVVMIPNGIDLAEFDTIRPLPRRNYLEKFSGQSALSGPVVVSMGRLHRKKGFDVLIDAFAALLDEQAGALLLIAGADDGERLALAAQISRRTLGDRVFLVGEVVGQDKVDFLAGADLFVLPSHSENFGNVYLEAMAAGVPIVASKGTPWAEVETLGCGKWVDNTVPATAQAMRDMLRGDSAAMRERARLFARRYSWASIASQFHQVFNSMTGQPVSPRL